MIFIFSDSRWNFLPYDGWDYSIGSILSFDPIGVILQNLTSIKNLHKISCRMMLKWTYSTYSFMRYLPSQPYNLKCLFWSLRGHISSEKNNFYIFGFALEFPFIWCVRWPHRINFVIWPHWCHITKFNPQKNSPENLRANGAKIIS